MSIDFRILQFENKPVEVFFNGEEGTRKFLID